MPYHRNNLSLIPYAPWRVIVLAWAGKLLGIQFHIEGIPFGGSAYPHPTDTADEAA
jgi:hypothetical protein